MQTASTLFFYFRESLQLLYLPPFCIPTIIFAGSAAAAVRRSSHPVRTAWTRTYRIVLAQAFLWAATLVIGAVWAFDRDHPVSPTPWPLRAITFAFALSFLLNIYWIVRMKGDRWFAISVAALQFWLLLAANHIAWVAILGKA
jgi:hypothetical protein